MLAQQTAQRHNSGMNEHGVFEASRVDFCYGILLNQGLVEHSADVSIIDKAQAAENMIRAIRPTAENALALTEKERKSRLKTAIGYRAYLLPYLENASVDELREAMAANGWSTGQKIDTVASKGVKFYSNMAMLPRQEGYELSTESVMSRDQLHPTLATALETHDGPTMDLDDTIRKLGLSGRMNKFYAQSLLIAYGKVQPTSNTQAVANTISLALDDVLRRHKYHRGDSDSLVKQFSTSYQYALKENGEAPVFERLTDFAWQSVMNDMTDDGSVQLFLESTLAHQLDAIYPAQRTK